MDAPTPKLANAPRLPLTSRQVACLALIGSVLVVIASGCVTMREYVHNGFKVGPNYQKPPAPVADEWIDVKSDRVKTETRDLRDWWTLLNDPALNQLIEQAYRQNLDVRTAGTRILAARATRNIAAGNLFPQLQEQVQAASRNAISGNIANLPPFISRFFDDQSAGLNIGWEIDFWGRFRRAVEAGNAELDATVENYDDALVVMISEVASNYVQIRVFQQRIKYAESNIAIQTELSKQAEERLKGGVGRKIDQGQMRSNLTDTMALKEQLEIGLRLANNRLCILLGMPVRNLVPDLGKADIPSAPPEAGVGMPADLLRRRPDVRRSERIVAAQSARVGIATADLYPHVSLIGTLGYEAQNFNDLFTGRSFYGTIGPSVRWDILNYGRLVNAIRVQDAVLQTRILDYQSIVLRAGREVEDGIVQYLRAHTQTRFLDESAKEAKIAADEAVALSKDVKFDLNRAFVTSNFLVGQQDKLAVAQGDIALGLIQIYKALGGGWQIRLPATPPPAPAPVVPEPIPAPAPPGQLQIEEPAAVRFMRPSVAAPTRTAER